MDTQKKVTDDKKDDSTDKVDNLGNSREPNNIVESASRLLEVREARVQAIKESVIAGTYIVYPFKVAEKMLKWI
jgi:anti-sigma28 factor (negative regulator of flagellin synthesis)